MDYLARRIFKWIFPLIVASSISACKVSSDNKNLADQSPGTQDPEEPNFPVNPSLKPLIIGGGRAPLNFGKSSHSSIVMNNKLYTYGGSEPNFGQEGSSRISDRLFVFDPEAGSGGSWTQLDPSGTSPGSRYLHSATSLSNKMYIFAGNFDNHLFVYDPSTGGDGTWAQLSPAGTLPAVRVGHSAVTIGEKMYVFGGANNGVNRNDLVVYDPNVGAQGTWTTLNPSGSVPSARNNHDAVVIAGKMYIFGGSGSSLMNDLYVFDPTEGSDGSWTHLNPAGTAPEARVQHAITNCSDRICIFGGYGSSAIGLDTVSIYNPASGTDGAWTSITTSGSIPSARHFQTATTILDKVFIFGGYTATSIATDEIYSLDSNGAWKLWDSPVFLGNQLGVPANESLPYLIGGGTAPYSVSVDMGSLSTTTDSGNFVAPGYTGTAVVTVVDSKGVIATSTIAVAPMLVIDVVSTSINDRDSTNYTVSGGSGTYTVYGVLGYVDSTTGDGTFFADSGPGAASIHVTDSYGTEYSVNLTIAALPPLQISVADGIVATDGSTTYTISGGSGTWSVSASSGSISNSSGSGTYTAPSSSTTATIFVQDDVTSEEVDVTITVE